MFSKRVIVESTNKVINHYRFNINDPVLCTVKNCDVRDAIILSRNTIKGDNYYKIGNKQTSNTKVCKEKELIHR